LQQELKNNTDQQEAAREQVRNAQGLVSTAQNDQERALAQTALAKAEEQLISVILQRSQVENEVIQTETRRIEAQEQLRNAEESLRDTIFNENLQRNNLNKAIADSTDALDQFKQSVQESKLEREGTLADLVEQFIKAGGDRAELPIEAQGTLDQDPQERERNKLREQLFRRTSLFGGDLNHFVAQDKRAREEQAQTDNLTKLNHELDELSRSVRNARENIINLFNSLQGAFKNLPSSLDQLRQELFGLLQGGIQGSSRAAILSNIPEEAPIEQNLENYILPPEDQPFFFKSGFEGETDFNPFNLDKETLRKRFQQSRPFTETIKNSFERAIDEFNQQEKSTLFPQFNLPFNANPASVNLLPQGITANQLNLPRLEQIPDGSADIPDRIVGALNEIKVILEQKLSALHEETAKNSISTNIGTIQNPANVLTEGKIANAVATALRNQFI